jgi:hypothetical protein
LFVYVMLQVVCSDKSNSGCVQDGCWRKEEETGSEPTSHDIPQEAGGLRVDVITVVRL